MVDVRDDGDVAELLSHDEVPGKPRIIESSAPDRRSFPQKTGQFEAGETIKGTENVRTSVAVS